jgi:dTDP-4-dehydrorhamnose 3,5-epimerase/reductase
MDDSRLVIIGANGQLGTALQKKYPRARAVDTDALDITNYNAVESFDWENVTHILNAAAYTNVDGAETPEGRVLSWAVNSTGVANLARIANKHNICLVHISTDYVFDGRKEIHDEYEPFSPLSVYGASKAAGDIAASLCEKHYILRTSWVIGEGKNFVRTMMDLADKNVSPTVVHDQIGRLTFTAELVRAIDHLLSISTPYGTYNVSNDGDPVSWADITREIFELLDRSDLTVTNTTTEEYFSSKPGMAPRPLKSTLDLTKIQATGFKPTDWRENIKHYIKEQK